MDNERWSALEESETVWKTSVGKFYTGERVILRGKNLHEAFYSSEWMQVFVYSITGRLYSGAELELLNSIWVYTSYPDPRIWTNRVASLSGSAQSTCAMSIAASIAVAESRVYGRQLDYRAISFFYRLKKELENGCRLLDLIKAELKRSRSIAGFGRPNVKGDERIPVMLRRAKELGLDGGYFLKLVMEIETTLQDNRYRYSMNYGALAAALAADLGLSPREYYEYTSLCFAAGAMPCYLDALERREGTFFPLKCKRIVYRGASRRTWQQ